MAGFSRSLLLAAAAGLGLPAVALAQNAVDGRVVRLAGVDTVGVPDVRVVLHGVSTTRQGPVDSIRSRADGRFRFRFRADSGVIYLLSARFREIEYFSTRIGVGQQAETIAILVSDTSQTVPIGIRARYLLAGAPDQAEGRTVVDVVVLHNDSPLTRVAPDSLVPVWAMALPTGVPEVVVDEGTEISREAVVVRRDSVLVFAPLPPGSRQLVLTYRIDLDAPSLRVPFGRAADSVTVLVEEPAARVDAPGLREVAERVAGQPVRGWLGPLAAGAEVTIHFPVAPRSTGLLVAGLVVALAAALGTGLWRHRRRTPATPQAPADRVEDLVHAIAALDNAQRDAAADPEAVARYQAEREALRRRLDRALARAGRRS